MTRPLKPLFHKDSCRAGYVAAASSSSFVFKKEERTSFQPDKLVAEGQRPFAGLESTTAAGLGVNQLFWR